MRNLTALIPLTLLIATGAAAAAGAPTFEDRVQAQLAIERVAWAHRTGDKPPFEAAVPRRVVESKVRRALAESVALERIWGERLTASRLRQELDRMAGASRSPGRLAEIFAALGDDPVLLQECLARPALVARLVRSRFEQEPEIHDGTGRETTFDAWWAENEPRFDAASARSVGDAALGRPFIADSAEALCSPDNTWDGGLSQPGTPPYPRLYHATVWTGWELIVWSGLDPRFSPQFAYHTDGGSYEPATDTWTAIASGPLSGRARPSAVWTGSSIVVWGGGLFPPASQANYTMLSDGAKYDPVAHSWGSISAVNAPSARWDAAMVRSGSTVVVYGGQIAHPTVHGALFPVYDGKRYDPATDTWLPMAASPLATGTVTYGASLGGRVWYWSNGQGAGYDPVTNQWISMATAGAPSGRFAPVVQGTDHEILVWGGSSATFLNDGELYDPATQTWRAMSGTGAPSPRRDARAVWTGSKMFVWGGTVSTGGSYVWDGGVFDPLANTWTAAALTGAPEPRSSFSLTWTGSLALLWGGGPLTGGRYALGHDTDDDGDGYSECGGDCNDGNSSVWSPPVEVTGLTFAADKETISWVAASSGSVDPPTYTLYRSTQPDLFSSSACPASDVLATSASDAAVPAPGEAFYFLVGSANDCARRTVCGAGSDGTDRGAACAP